MRQRRTHPARENFEAVAQASRHALDAEGGDARGGELDRERNAIEPSAEGANRRRLRVHLGDVARLDSARPRDEELHGAVAENAVHVDVVLRGDIERRDAGEIFSGGAPVLPGGGGWGAGWGGRAGRPSP